MSRRVLITKVENTTVVTTWDTKNPQNQNIFDYTTGANIRLKNDVLTIEKPYLTHPVLFISYDQLEDDLGANDIAEYKELLDQGNYFTTSQSDGGVGGSQTLNTTYPDWDYEEPNAQVFQLTTGYKLLNLVVNGGRVLEQGTEWTQAGTTITVTSFDLDDQDRLSGVAIKLS